MKLKPSHPALTEARTIHTKKVRQVTPDVVLIKPASDNGKMGKGISVVQKGIWRGMPLFVLTLEERKTCPSDCLRWEECFGNGTPFAHRFEHGPELEAKLAQEIGALAHLYPHGFVVRLHVLGDFYSVQYVGFWFAMLAKHGNLRVYGYTARHGVDPIWTALHRVRIVYGDRFWIRQSRNQSYDRNQPELIYAAQEGTAYAITCPEQTGKSESCLTCGLCWAINTTIEFIDHDKLNKQRKLANENSNG